MSSTFIDGNTELKGNERRGDGRTIPERMATYFLTVISLANLFSPGSTNEVEAAGLSETATTTPLRKANDDIPESKSSTDVWRERGKEGQKGETRLAQSSGRLFRKIKKMGIGRKEKRNNVGNALASCSAQMFLPWVRLAVRFFPGTKTWFPYVRRKYHPRLPPSACDLEFLSLLMKI